MDSRRRHPAHRRLIFGSQAVSDAKRDAHIATRIAEHLETHDKGEISHLRTVNKATVFAAIT